MYGMNLNIDMTDWSTEDRVAIIEHVGRIEAKLGGRPIPTSSVAPALPEEYEPSGWNQEAYLEVLTKLLSRHHVQVAVIFEAIQNGTGFVSREKVYELGNYPDTRSLKGFTRPVNRFTADAIEAGLLPEEAEDLLAPAYDPNVTSFQRAQGFRVPTEVVKLAQQWKADAEAKKAK